MTHLRTPWRALVLALAGLAAGLMTACTHTSAQPTVTNLSYARPDEVSITHMDLDLTVDFDTHRIHGTAAAEIDNHTGTDVLYLDTWALHVRGVTLDDGTPADWTLGDSLALVGRPLIVRITPHTRRVTVDYETTAGARGIQWLTPAQAHGDKPYLYSQSETIHARSWVPCQDTPAVRFTYRARLTVPKGLMALMSASNDTTVSPDGVYTFEMPQPIPSYLLAIAVGDIAFRSVSRRCGVYASPDLVDKAAWEFADLGKMMAAAEAINGPYRWDRYDVLVLPPSFPFGGMENPRLTFLTPILVAGDRSLVSTVAHELAHSWSGNLVTNATWDDFWLNEGFTVYFERRIDEKLYGREAAEMQAILGRQDLEDELNERGRDNPDTALHTNLHGRNPDEVLQTTPYEKGYLFLRLLEQTFGRPRFDAFLRQYFDKFAFQSMTTKRFQRYLERELFKGNQALIDSVGVDKWLYAPGLPANAPVAHSERFTEVEHQAKRFAAGTPARELDAQGWSTQELKHFLTLLPDSLAASRMADLEATFHFSRANDEVRKLWLLLVIGSHYAPAYPVLDDYLVNVGRIWMVEPLYKKLAATPEGLEHARAVYQKARPGYHALTRTAVERDLGPVGRSS